MSVKQTMVAVSKSAQTPRVHMNALVIQAIGWLVVVLTAMVNTSKFIIVGTLVLPGL